MTVQGQTDMWSSTTTPQTVDSGDGSAVELGVKFTSSQNGFITGIAFTRAPPIPAHMWETCGRAWHPAGERSLYG